MRENSKFQSLFDPEKHAYKNEYTRSIGAQIFKCHTRALGFHLYQCDNASCAHIHRQYHSCGNRHCPFCGTMKKDEWVEARLADLLPCPYYHVVFTVPHEWNQVMMQSPREMYKILFDASSETLLTLSAHPDYLGGVPGITSVLHTWGQKLDYHVHVHCIVSGGGLNSGNWVAPKRSNGKFLFPESALKKVYKGIFMRLVRERRQEMKVEPSQIDQAIETSGKKRWKVYAKKPFGGPDQVVKYLGRYTHRTAITSPRIKEITNDQVRFEYKDYRDDQSKEMVLTHYEFMRRFEHHILPARFVRIRHYGLLQNYGKHTRLEELRETMDWEQPSTRVVVSMAVRMLEKYGRDIAKCPCCESGRYQLWLTDRHGKVTYYRPRDGPDH